MMTIERGFRDADRPLVATLYWGAFGAKLGHVMGPERKALAYFEAVLSPDHALCARARDGALLGVAGFKTHEGALVGGGFREFAGVYGLAGAVWRVALLGALERDTDNARFLMDGIFVAPEARGLGVGTRLIDAIADEAVARGYAEVRLDVIDINTRARKLYERQGFVVVEEQRLGWLRHVFGFNAAMTMVRRVA